MEKKIKGKNSGPSGAAFNLSNYESQYDRFSWDDIREEIGGVSTDFGLNIGHLAVDRHAVGQRGDRAAIRWVEPDGAATDISYASLKKKTSRFANVLKALGVKRGDRVFVQSERIPELYVSALGALKYGAVFCPLFPAFGPELVLQRLRRGGEGILVTSKKLYKSRVEPDRDGLPGLKHVFLTDAEEDVSEGVWSFSKWMEGAEDRFDIPFTSPEDMALLHFTSGTTGMPKAAVHVHEAALVHYATGRYVLDLHSEDVFWCTADPGWVTGTSYGIVSPLAIGVTNVVDAGDFDPARWLSIIEKNGVTILYTAPTAIRRLMRFEPDFFEKYDLGKLRAIFSVGEPLNPDAVSWGEKTLGIPIRDTWWQTETGGIMIANFMGMDVKPGAMGKPVPGVRAAIVERKESGEVEVVTQAGREGELALKTGWPSMFRGYLNEPERYARCFAGDWYLTGDLAFRDEDGFFRFVGRNDDIIKTAGHMVGPFEVESALNAHPAVAESAVVGKPDPMIGEIVKSFVCLSPGFVPGEDLRLELLGYARKRLGTAAAPREIEFVDELPKNDAGKILRKKLKKNPADSERRRMEE